MGDVSQKEVIRYWLSTLVDDEIDVDDISSEDRLFRELRNRQSGPTSIFGDHSIEWELTELSEEEFRKLRIVKGPPDGDWRTFVPNSDSPTPSLESIAREIKNTDREEEFHPDARGKLPKVYEILDSYRSGESMGKLVLFKESQGSPPWIADGNHRAVAKMLCLMEGGEYRGQEAYLGRKKRRLFFG